MKKNNHYVSKQIRRKLRFNGITHKKASLYTLASGLQLCTQYHPVWGLPSVWDWNNSCWIEGNSSFDPYNCCIQHVANAVGLKCWLIRRLTDELIEAFADEDENRFCIPPIKHIIRWLKIRMRRG